MGCMVLGPPLMISVQRSAVLGHSVSEVPACSRSLLPSCIAHWRQPLRAARENHNTNTSPAHHPSTHPGAWRVRWSPASVFLETGERVGDGTYFIASYTYRSTFLLASSLMAFLNVSPMFSERERLALACSPTKPCDAQVPQKENQTHSQYIWSDCLMNHLLPVISKCNPKW